MIKTIFILFFLPLNLSANEVNWLEVKNTFKAYANSPSDKTALYALNALPNEHVLVQSKEALETNEFIYNYNQFGMLERQVISSHKLSVRLAFKLRSFADGAFSEDISILLGTLIRINPELFLLELEKAQPKVINFGAFLNNGPIFVDRLTASCNETLLRKNALNDIKNIKLDTLKEKMIMLANKTLLSSLCKNNITSQ